MLKDKDRIFTNLYGLSSPGLSGAQARGNWTGSRELMAKGREWLVEEIKASGLRGRGGAGFSAGMKWSFMPKEIGPPHFLLICRRGRAWHLQGS